MQILDTKNNLEKYLTKLKNKEVIIVSAFASNTENHLDTLLKNRNKIKLIIGTINAFSSPIFFKHCLNLINDRGSSHNLELFIDFRYENSIHWKLYLIKPNIVIIGSANFTKIGLSLARDTCVLIENENLFQMYVQKIEGIKNIKDVCKAQDTSSFNNLLEKYIKEHKNIQKGLSRKRRNISIDDWLNEESNQLVLLLMCDAQHTKSDIEKGHKLLRDDLHSKGEDDVNNVSDLLRTFFTYECEKNSLPYEEGDVVLCMTHTGSNPCFQTFDRIIYNNEEERYYIYCYKRKSYMRPFNLNPMVRENIRKYANKWYEKNIIELSQNDILELI